MDLRCDLSDLREVKNGDLPTKIIKRRIKWERNDCGVIALSIGAGISYKMAHEMLKRWGRKSRSFTPEWRKFISWSPLRFKRYATHNITLGKFLKRHPVGTFIVLFRPKDRHNCHAANVIDGFYIDRATGETSRSVVTDAWMVTGLKSWAKR